MSVMPDIVEFLTARLDETQVDAEAAHAGPWVTDLDDEVDENVTDASGQIVAWVRARPTTAATRAHIARHDPARVLAEVKAKRGILALHQPEQVEYLDGDGQDRMSTDCTTCDTCGGADTWPCDTVKLLAAPYADHPDYNPAWNVNAT